MFRLRFAVACTATLLATGCAQLMAPSYSSDYASLDRLKTTRPEKTSVAPFQPTDPTLVYSRPKGEYSGADAEKVALDFYLLNAELGEGKYAVRATVTPASGMPETIMVKSWAPYDLVNLPHGEAKVKLELLDKDGKVVPGRFNSTERSIKVVRQGL